MPESLKKLVNLIWYLPWIWEKSATKLALFLLSSNKNYVDNFKDALREIKEEISYCEDCHSLIDSGKGKCSVCLSEIRNSWVILVVEDYLDMLSIEQTWVFEGKYHVLGWAISPINWVFAWDLNFSTLFKRIEGYPGNVEIVLGTNPNIEGEATNSFIREEVVSRELSYKVTITKLSRGLSSGYIEYADNITLVSALKDRKEI